MKPEYNTIMDESGQHIGVLKNQIASQNIFDGPGSPDQSVQTNYLGKIKLEQHSMARLGGGGDHEGGPDIEPRGVGNDSTKNEETKGKNSLLSSRL